MRQKFIAIWHEVLGKNPRAGHALPVPDEWTPVPDFLQSILQLRQDRRLTAVSALQHPFIQLASKFRVEGIPRSTQARTVGGRRMAGPAGPAGANGTGSD